MSTIIDNDELRTRRLQRKNKLDLDIKSTELLITRAEETSGRLRTTNMGTEYITTQIEKLKIDIEEKSSMLASLISERDKLVLGELDGEIINDYLQSKAKTLRDNETSLAKKAVKKEEHIEKKAISDKYWKNIVSESKACKEQNRDMNYNLRYFYKTIDSLPDYLLKNLSEMPNNKGYIYRSIYLYGDLPAEKGPTVLFEKLQGGVLVIHEYYPTEYRRYEKIGQNRKQLINVEPRKVKKCGVSLADFVTR
jgi:hypothetical protein